MTDGYLCKCGHQVKPGERHVTWEEANRRRDREESAAAGILARLDLKTGLWQRTKPLLARLFKTNFRKPQRERI